MIKMEPPKNCLVCNSPLITAEAYEDMYYVDCPNNSCVEISCDISGYVRWINITLGELTFSMLFTTDILSLYADGYKHMAFTLPDFDYSDWPSVIKKLEMYKLFL